MVCLAASFIFVEPPPGTGTSTSAKSLSGQRSLTALRYVMAPIRCSQLGKQIVGRAFAVENDDEAVEQRIGIELSL